jgi:peptidoglycan hydrolase-like protein with peptidoglycan-binding domain
VVLLLAGAAIANVAYLQVSPRERRLTQIPVGLATPLPDAKRAAEARRSGGPVTLSLASLLETAPASTQVQSQQPVATPAASAPTSPAAVVSDSRAPSPSLSVGQLIAQSSEPHSEPRSQAEPQPQGPAKHMELVRQIQSELASRGYAPGPVDGDAGLLTRAAILAFEHDRGLPATAEATDVVLAALRAPAPTRRTARGADWRSPSRTALALVTTVQQQLIAVGYLTGTPSGQIDARTITAIRSFETANDMLATGRISAPLVAKLQRASAPRARLASGQ